MKRYYLLTFTCLVSLFCLSTNLLQANTPQLNVINYTLTLKPDLKNKSIEGNLEIQFESSEKSITLNSGQLQVNQVTGENVKSFKQADSKVIIELLTAKNATQQFSISYKGKPSQGLLFNPKLEEAHTVYFTSDWMICNDDPSDRASLNLNLLVPNHKQCIASGELVKVEKQQQHSLYQWKQTYETPAYTYGFVIGSFTKVTEQVGDVSLNYYATNLSKDTLKKVFLETPAMLRFFEEKTGIRYMQNTYSQILIGNNYQEISGLAVFNRSYVAAVLKDSSEIHLTAHELAHQWWGNMITCKSFSHFWLNEAFAVYMASAFNEQKFGKAKYDADIALYKQIYDSVKKKGQDKSLVFRKWFPTRVNRSIAYYKGAYVLHLLREKLGDELFWRGIRLYTQTYYGKAVETNDFKSAMEKASTINLDAFFNKWVYHKG